MTREGIHAAVEEIVEDWHDGHPTERVPWKHVAEELKRKAEWHEEQLAEDIASWDELCPDGFLSFYEGNDPDGFAAEMLELFGLDVRAVYDPAFDPGGPGTGALGWDEIDGDGAVRAFFIPGGLVGAIYGSNRWRLGS